MNAKLQEPKKTWIDPDDAPELTDEFFEKATWTIAGKVVTRAEAQASIAARKRPGRPTGSGSKVSTTIRFDAEVLEAFRQQGPGWQTRMNDALKDWLATHRA